MRSDASTKSWEAEHLTLRVVSLYQPVAVEQDAVTLSKRWKVIYSLMLERVLDTRSRSILVC